MNKKFLLCAVIFSVLIIAGATTWKKHTVKKHDTLWDIADNYYNDPFLWPVIYRANQDSIADPHWIYPGEVFVIPEVPAEQEAALPEEEGIVTRDTFKTISETTVPPPSLKKEEYTPSDEQKIFSVIGQKNYAFTGKSAFLAGYISPEDRIRIGKINDTYPSSGVEEHSVIMGEKLQIDKGTADGINEGDIYTIFEWGRSVGGFGRIVRIKGIIKVIEEGENLSVARILESYEEIRKGDYFMEYDPPPSLEGDPQPTTLPLEGRIIAFKNDDPIKKPFSVVYISPGEGEVRIGDIFLIYKERKGEGENPIIPLGKIQIVNVKEETSSGYLISIMGNMGVSSGDRIKLAGRIES